MSSAESPLVLEIWPSLLVLENEAAPIRGQKMATIFGKMGLF
jgi:hypothetical protein